MKGGAFWFIMSDGCLWKVYPSAKAASHTGTYGLLDTIDLNLWS